MFITKRAIPRRTFLRGAGVTLALPLLESMIPAATALAQTPAAGKPRFVGVFYPHAPVPLFLTLLLPEVSCEVPQHRNEILFTDHQAFIFHGPQ